MIRAALLIVLWVGLECFYIEVHDTATNRRATLWATANVVFVPRDNKDSLLFSTYVRFSRVSNLDSGEAKTP